MTARTHLDLIAALHTQTALEDLAHLIEQTTREVD